MRSFAVPGGNESTASATSLRLLIPPEVGQRSRSYRIRFAAMGGGVSLRESYLLSTLCLEIDSMFRLHRNMHGSVRPRRIPHSWWFGVPGSREGKTMDFLHPNSRPPRIPELVVIRERPLLLSLTRPRVGEGCWPFCSGLAGGLVGCGCGRCQCTSYLCWSPTYAFTVLPPSLLNPLPKLRLTWVTCLPPSLPRGFSGHLHLGGERLNLPF